MNIAITSLSEQQEQEQWQLLADASNADARLQLINHYLELAHKIAAQLYRHRPDDAVEFDDYYQFAVVGLVESVDRFVPGGETSFATYASYRIRGSILNGIEKASEYRQQIAFKQRVRRQRVESLAPPTSDDEADNLFAQMVDLTTGLAIGYMLEDSGITYDAENRNSQDSATRYGVEQINARLLHAIEQLPERDRMIINYHYFHHISFNEISRIFDVSKGRISQIHRRVLQTIRNSLAEADNIDSYY